MVGFFRDSRGSFGGGRGGGFGGRRSFGGNRGGFRREMHKATCAECKKECEVPFKPRGDRPVYCLDCFKKRKAGEESGMPKEEKAEETEEEMEEMPEEGSEKETEAGEEVTEEEQ